MKRGRLVTEGGWPNVGGGGRLAGLKPGWSGLKAVGDGRLGSELKAGGVGRLGGLLKVVLLFWNLAIFNIRSFVDFKQFLDKDFSLAQFFNQTW